jgi:DNA-binding CsgD family transcriptional regulator
MSVPSVHWAYECALTYSRPRLRDVVEALPGDALVPRLMLAASIEQLSGNTEKATALLRSALRGAAEPDRPFVIDLLAPIYFMQGRTAELNALLEIELPERTDIARLVGAMRAVAAAEAGDIAEARRASNVPDARWADSPLAEARLAQRFALVALHCKDYEGAISLAEASAKTFGELGAHRLRATSYSILYNIHHSVTRDIGEALAWARGMTECAILADDRSFETVGLVAQYEIAAEMFDRDALARLQLQLRSNAYPPQYRERFSARIADFMPFAWDADFVAFANGITALRDGLATSAPMKALCYGLLALAAVHAGDDEGAREHSRRAIELANLKDASRVPMYEARYCRLARSLAAAACILIGDTVRGQRISASRTHESDEDMRAIVAVAEGLDVDRAPARVRGYARIVGVALAERATLAKCVLTRAEIEVIRLLANGHSAAEIATRSMRSVHTVRNHTRSIIAKFEVSGRMAAVARARQLGIIP